MLEMTEDTIFETVLRQCTGDGIEQEQARRIASATVNDICQSLEDQKAYHLIQEVFPSEPFVCPRCHNDPTGGCYQCNDAS